MPTPATPTSDAPSRCFQNIYAEGKSVQKEDLEFLHLDDLASSSVTELGLDGNQFIHSENPDAFDLNANATNHESSRGSEQQTQIDRRGSITAPSGKGFDLSSWQADPIILNEPPIQKGYSPNLTSLRSENIFWELSEFGTASEDESPDKCDFHTTPNVRKQ